MSSERPTIRLTRPLGAVRAGPSPSSAPQRPSAEQEGADDLRRRLAAEQERSAQAQAELARREQRLAEREKALDEQLTRLADLIAAAEQERTELLRENEEEIVSFSLSITEKVLQYEIENGRYKIGAIVAATLQAVRDKGSVLVRVNPRDLEQTQEALKRVSQFGESGRISAVADESIQPASCCIETDSGKVFSEVPERLKRIEQSLLKRNGKAHGL
jgi:flagellar biosynthesis/type III secretory pathway protein FliH